MSTNSKQSQGDSAELRNVKPLLVWWSVLFLPYVLVATLILCGAHQQWQPLVPAHLRFYSFIALNLAYFGVYYLFEKVRILRGNRPEI
jgi:hypothetical protein